MVIPSGEEDAMGFVQEGFVAVVSRAEEVPTAPSTWLYWRILRYLRPFLRKGERQQLNESTYSATWDENAERQAELAAHEAPQELSPFRKVRENPCRILRKSYEKGILGPKTLELMVAQVLTGQFPVVARELGLNVTTAHQRVKEGQRRLAQERPRRPYSISRKEKARVQATLQRLQSKTSLPAVPAPVISLRQEQGSPEPQVERGRKVMLDLPVIPAPRRESPTPQEPEALESTVFD
jgi:DNA-directed RNA polymerase specialized sigma24 family protein